MKRYYTMDKGELSRTLASLPELDREILILRWKKFYGVEPPARIRKNFLIRGIAYRLQDQALGGLKPATRRFLEKAGDSIAMGKKIPALGSSIKKGMKLLREWHGVTHEVIVQEDGILFCGRHYRSLSEVARVITGVRWSGPLFFGLTKGTHE